MSRLHSRYGSMAPAQPLQPGAPGTGVRRLRAERSARLDREAATRYTELAPRRGEDRARYLAMAADALASAAQWDAEADDVDGATGAIEVVS